MPAGRPLPVTAVLALVVAATAIAQAQRPPRQAAPDHATRDAEDYALALECRGALWAKTFADAQAAGLNPGATPIAFEASKATKTRSDGHLTVTGIEEYQPSHEVPPIPARYECVVDLGTKQVLTVTYTALDAEGAPLAKAPPQLVREARYVRACREELGSKVHGDAVDRGVSTGGNDAEPDPGSVVLTPSGSKLEISGRGRVRLSSDYEWQPMTFTCSYDEKKQRVTKASYRVARAHSVAPLTPDRQRALDACRSAVREEIVQDAQRRGYRWAHRVEVSLKSGANFTVTGDSVEVTGEGEFRSDARHSQPAPITFTCRYDTARAQVASASFMREESGRAPSGEIASGKAGTLVCESFSDVQRVCPAAIRGNVRIIRQISRTPCESYKNWIYSTSGITVWGGCRAEFEFDAR